MRFFYVAFLALLGVAPASAQIQEPVKWSTAYKRLSDTEGEISIKATIQTGWHLYSQKTDPVFLPLVFS